MPKMKDMDDYSKSIIKQKSKKVVGCPIKISTPKYEFPATMQYQIEGYDTFEFIFNSSTK